ncbi:MAG TPA: 50S ribosomal protein L10 [Gemmatimonadaceae bacterium]|jgi:large subunit ribosomal protein L10|nr:50S ribosomal protein L10 [Gemmatimonadaceae bacterium]
MKRTEKEEAVTALSEQMRGIKALYFTDFTGLNVKRMTDLRRRFRKAGVQYVVIKNTLALRAATASGLTGVGDRLAGPTGVVLAKDPVAAAKVLADFARENDKRPTVKGGMLDGVALTEDQIKKLATMPSREQMLAQLGGAMQAPLVAFVSGLSALLSTFVGALEARKAQVEGAGA